MMFGHVPPVDGSYVKPVEQTWEVFTTVFKDLYNSVSRITVDNVNSKDSVDLMRKFHPDLILLSGAPIISKAIIGIPRYGVLNPHYGITPRYAGNNPTYWPLFENRIFDIGYTIHQVVPQVDSGPIVEQVRLPWRTDWSWSTLGSYLGEIMYERLCTISLEWILNGPSPTRSQVVNCTKPPAGYFVRVLAERRKAQLYQKGIRSVVPPEWGGNFQSKTDFSKLSVV
jgi:methionyl-tRNA formyltransferase